MSIDRRAIAKFQKDLQREFDKRPIKIAIDADAEFADRPGKQSVVNHYHAPIVTVNGDQAQLAWGDGAVTQTQKRVSQIADGYEDIARIVAEVLAKLDVLQLNAEDNYDVRKSAETVLGEVVKAEPDRSAIRRGVTMLKGLLATVATGVNQSVATETAKFARGAIETLGQAISS